MKKWMAAKRRAFARPRTLVTIQSGANINFHRLRHVSERSELGEKREGIFAVTIPEQNGQLPRPVRGARRSARHRIQLPLLGRRRRPGLRGLQLARGRGGARADRHRAARGGLRVVDMTDNELAVLHVRHMVGGRTPDPARELLFRFEFPERPGALRRFLG